jgi:hypothetical protein
MVERPSPGGGALNVVARLIFPTLVTGAVVAALIATAGTPAVVPQACTIDWTMVGHTVIFSPKCPRTSPPSPDRAPSGNQPQQGVPAPN